MFIKLATCIMSLTLLGSTFSYAPTNETDGISMFYYDKSGDLQYFHDEVSEDFSNVRIKKEALNIEATGGQVVKINIEDNAHVIVEPTQVKSSLSINGMDRLHDYSEWKKAISRTKSSKIDSMATGKGVIIAIIDTGVSSHSYELKGKLLPGVTINGGASNNALQDDFMHGTFTAIVAAGNKDGYGTQGLAYDAKILPIKVDHERKILQKHVIEGIMYAANSEADIINVSLSSNYSADEEFAVNYALSKGKIVVAASGNRGLESENVNYPAGYDGVFSIGNYDQNTNTMSKSSGKFNNFIMPGMELPLEPWVDPKDEIITKRQTKHIQWVSGTSFAAPYFSGLIALILEKKPSITQDELNALLVKHSSTPFKDPNSYAGHGVPDVNAIVKSLMSSNGSKVKEKTQTVTYDSSFSRKYSVKSDTNITVEKLQSNKWVKVSTVKTSKKSANVVFKPTHSGSMRYRVTANGTRTHLATVLDEFVVTVKPFTANKKTIKDSSVKKNKVKKYSLTLNVDTKVNLLANKNGKWVKVKTFTSKKKKVDVVIPTNKIGKTKYKITALAKGKYTAVDISAFTVHVKK